MLLPITLLLAAAEPVETHYHVYVSMVDGTCSYAIQDMIFGSPEEAMGWIRKLPKDWHIDIIWSEEADKACILNYPQLILNYPQLIKDAGFPSVVVKYEKVVRDDSGLPPFTAP